jgi:hypothetical protein
MSYAVESERRGSVGRSTDLSIIRNGSDWPGDGCHVQAVCRSFSEDERRAMRRKIQKWLQCCPEEQIATAIVPMRALAN